MGPRRKVLVPFRGSTLEVWDTTLPGTMAVIAQIGLQDPKLDAFYRAAGTIVRDCNDRIVWPKPEKPQETSTQEEVDEDDVLSLFAPEGE